MPEPVDKSADQSAEEVPQKTKPRRNWLSYSLRSLMIALTLCCLAVGGKLKYDWYQKKWLVEKWVAPLVQPENEYDQRLPEPASPTPGGVKPEQEVPLLQFGILELDTPKERFAALKILVSIS